MGSSQINGKAQKMGRNLSEEDVLGAHSGMSYLCHEGGATIDTIAAPGLLVIVLAHIVYQDRLSLCHFLKILSPVGTPI